MRAAHFVDLRRVLRHPGWDALAIALSAVHGLTLLVVPSVPVIALGLWWNANTIAHQFIHAPFFRAHALNRAYSLYLTLLLGIPQTLWRKRHLDHHFPARTESSIVSKRRGLGRTQRAILIEVGLLCVAWATLAWMDSAFFVNTYLPGWAIGLALCQLHGYYEHAHGTTSHYGRVYNVLFFNDGYHLEHHARPSAHWSDLVARSSADRRSRWPPVLRWLDVLSLTGLERLVLRVRWLQRLTLEAHMRAFERLSPRLFGVRRAIAVGGGLFPRTPIVLRQLLPDAQVIVFESEANHLAIARPLVDGGVDWQLATFSPVQTHDVDLIVVPLAYVGDRHVLYAHPPARLVIVHDWIWRPRGESVIVAWWLLKRINLLHQETIATHTHSSAA